jgi:hypothetical protein
MELPVVTIRQVLLTSLAFLPDAVRSEPGTPGLPWSVKGQVVPVRAARLPDLALDAACL